MNKFRKIAIGALLAASAGCLTVAAAGCNSEPDYFKLTFEGKGLDYVFQGELAPESGEQFVSGYLVKSGVEVRFTLALSENTEGTPVILLNGSEITADEDGVYSFILDKESVVSVSGLTEKKKVTFSRGDYYKFIDEDGNEITDRMAVKGSSVKFKVWVSPYMVPEYTVTNNTEELEPDAEGYYTISDISDDSTVNISTLVQADSFLERGEGSGTADDPFIVREPIDMFMVAALVNSDFYMAYSTAYYKLEADIDMQGEKLYVIGDMSNANAVFCGNFDGNGHKVSNFYITDEVIDQESFAKEYLPYVGVFGAAVATTGGPVVIKNLIIEDYEITVHPSLADSVDQQYFAGSLVAYGIGAQIEGCRAVNGRITAQNDAQKTCNVGGLVGVLQSAYDNTRSTVLTYDAYVNGCYADVQISGNGVLYCVGGAVGMLATADTQAIAYVSNTVTTGSVSGTIFVGGVVGNLSRFSSVANCYSSSAVTARNTNNTVGMAELIKSANAGGIVGYAENDAVISGCYSANTAINASSASNNKFASQGEICAKSEEAYAEASDAAQAVLHNNLAKDGGSFELLGWSADEWDLTGAIPVYKGASVRTVTLTVKAGENTVDTINKTLWSIEPIYAWYGEDMDEYIANSEGRSWGYYFDKELTRRVPNGYIPLSDAVLYVGFADYSEVEGQYYLGATTYGVNAYFTLDSDGSYFFRDGGLTYTGSYSYDGNKVTLYYSCFGAMAFTAEETNGSYATMVMEKDGNGYKLNGKIYVRQFTNATEYTTALAELSFTATKKSDTFIYGEYTNSNGAVLVLKENGTGNYTVGNSVRTLTFTATDNGKIGNSLNLSIDVVDGKVTSFNNSPASLKDGFAGTWKTSAGSAIEYTFDGFGVVTCGGVTGTYEEIAQGKALISLGGNVSEAVLYSDSLYIDGTAYFLSDGFTGAWTGSTSASNERFELMLGGIGKDGYGKAEITFYAGVTSTVSGEYTVTEDGVMVLYVGDTLYGELKYNKVSGKAEGLFFSYSTYSARNEITYVSVQFTLFDLFRGVWECNVEGIKQINFTGKTAGGSSATAIVTYTNGRTGEATYSLDSATEGRLTIGADVYNIVLDERANTVSLTLGAENAGSLAQKDVWSGVTLYEGEKTYTFDGRSNLGGKVTVSDGTALPYVLGEGALPVIDGIALIATEEGFSWGDKTLVFKTGFANTWVKSGDNSELTISEVKADFTATVTVGGKTYVYRYNPERNTLVYSETDRKGVTTDTTIGLKGGKELSVTVTGAVSDSTNYIAKDALDGWTGTYTAQDGSTWVFDGHGLAEYGSGLATYTQAGKKTVYSYRQNSLGLVQILTGTGKGMLFTEVAQGGYKKEGSSKAYTPVAADALYLTEVRLNGEFVTLDGAGNIWSAGEKTAYTYTYLTTVSNVSYLVVKGGEGTKSLSTITKEGGINVLTLNEFEEWTLRDTDKKYIFVGGSTGTLWRADGDNYVREYYYESDSEYATLFYLTDMDEKEYKMTIRKTDKTFVLEELKDED